MQTTAPDREDVQPEIICPNPPDNDAELREVFALWLDLGGSD